MHSDDMDMLKEAISPIIEMAKPLNMEIDIKCDPETCDYIITFDGTTTYKQPEDWEHYYLSFADFCQSMLRIVKLPWENITEHHKFKVSANIGNVLDMLANQ